MWDLYWLTRLDGIHTFFENMFAICTMLAVFGFIAWFIVKICDISCKIDDDDKKMVSGLTPFCIWTTIFAVVFSLLSTLTPTTKEACMIYLGGNVIEYVRGNEQLQEMPDKVVKLADEYLNELIEQKNADKSK